MVKTTLVIDLVADTLGHITTDKLISSAVMGTGNVIMGTYDASHVYNKGDKIPYINDSGQLEIIVAIEDGITGPFDMRKWEEWNVISELNRLYNDYIVLSWSPPVSRVNKVWLSIKNQSMADFKDLNLGDNSGVLVYNNLVMSANEPAMTNDVIWGHITEKV